MVINRYVRGRFISFLPFLFHLYSPLFQILRQQALFSGECLGGGVGAAQEGSRVGGVQWGVIKGTCRQRKLRRKSFRYPINRPPFVSPSSNSVSCRMPSAKRGADASHQIRNRGRRRRRRIPCWIRGIGLRLFGSTVWSGYPLFEVVHDSTYFFCAISLSIIYHIDYFRRNPFKVARVPERPSQ